MNSVLFFTLTCTLYMSSAMSVHSKCEDEAEIVSEVDDECYHVGTRGPCGEDQWFVLREGGRRGVCQTRKCHLNAVYYTGKCLNFFAPTACPVGERLYITLEGKGRCDCMDGWMKNHSRADCYQEFTRGYCGKGEVLRFKTSARKIEALKTKSSGGFLFPSQLAEIREKKSLVCIDNPCPAGKLPHSDTWEKNQTCHQVDPEVLQEDDCEVAVREDDVLICGIGRGNIIPFSLAPVNAGRRCRRGRVWSKYRKRCVRTYG